MYPASSSALTRRRHGGGEMPTRLANSTLVIRPSAWISLRILRSISSRFFDSRGPGPGLEEALRFRGGNTLSALNAGAQFYCACAAQKSQLPRRSREILLIWIAILA